MELQFEKIGHLEGYVIKASGLSVDLCKLIQTVRGIIQNIDSPASDLLSHEEISKLLKESLCHDE